MALIKVKDSQGNWTVSPIIAKQNVYSTDEQIVGTWIDGKPLYRKVIDFGNLPNSSVKSVAHNISNLDHFVSGKGIAIRNDSAKNTLAFPCVDPDGVQYAIYLALDNTNVRVSTGSSRANFTAYITLEYTKTTD